MTTAQDRKLGRQEAGAAAWNVAAYVSGRVILLISTIATTRLLDPEDFGLLGLAVAITTFLDALNSFGLPSAYLYFARKGDSSDDRIANTTFVLSMAIGVVLTVLTIALSPLAAWFYDEPRVTPILSVLAVSFIFMSVGSVHDARLRLRLDFRKRFYAEVSRAAFKGFGAIALAVAGLGVWSLVLGHVLGAAAFSGTFLLVERWRPRLQVDRAVSRRMLGYGSHMASVGLLSLAATNVDYVIIGRRLGAVELGYYTVAFRLPSLAIRGTSAFVSQVVMSAFVRLEDDAAALRVALTQSMRLMAYFTVPTALGLAAVGPTAVTTLFGETWEPAGTLTRIIAVYSMLWVLVYNAGDVYKATGRPGILNVTAGVALVAAVPLIWVAAGRGIEEVAYAQIVVAILVLITHLVLLHRILEISPLRVLITLAPPLAAGGVMTAAVLVAQSLLQGQAGAVVLTGAVLVGAIVYVPAVALLDPAAVPTIRRLVIAKRNGRSAA